MKESEREREREQIIQYNGRETACGGRKWLSGWMLGIFGGRKSMRGGEDWGMSPRTLWRISRPPKFFKSLSCKYL